VTAQPLMRTVKNQNVDDQSEAWSEINEYGFQRQNPKRGFLSSCHCRAAVKTLGINFQCRRSRSASTRKRCRQATCSFSPVCCRTEAAKRNSSGASAQELDVEACHKAARLPQLNALAGREATSGIARQSDTYCPARRRRDHFGDVREQQRWLTALQSCCKTFSEKTKP